MEKGYAQIEKELLSIVFSCKKFYNYIYGRTTIIITDHKPLVSIFRKDISQICSSRLQRIRLKLLPYDLRVQYMPGKFLYVAGCFILWHTINFDPQNVEEVDKSFDEVVHSANINQTRLEKIKLETKNNEELRILCEYSLEGWPKNKDKIKELADNMPFKSFEFRKFGDEWKFKIVQQVPNIHEPTKEIIELHMEEK